MSPLLKIETCSILEKFASSNHNSLRATSSSEKLNRDQLIVQAIIKVLLSSDNDDDDDDVNVKNGNMQLTEWLVFAEKALSVLYLLVNDGAALVHDLIRSFSKRLNMTSAENIYINTNDLCKLLFLLGHGVLKELISIELIYREKRVKLADGAKKKEKKNSFVDASDGGDSLELDTVVEKENEIDDWLVEQERSLISETSLYGSFLPLIRSIVSSPNFTNCANDDEKNNNSNGLILRCAVLALCKYMCVHVSVWYDQHNNFMKTICLVVINVL